jgi:hypothetical protein
MIFCFVVKFFICFASLNLLLGAKASKTVGAVWYATPFTQAGCACNGRAVFRFRPSPKNSAIP